MTLRRSLLCLAAGLSVLPSLAPAGAATVPATARQSLVLDGRLRTYQLYVPDNLPARAPVVFVLHGAGGDGLSVRDQTGKGFERLADANHFIVVYPDGYDKHWNDCRKSSTSAARQLNVDDEGFLLKIADDLHDRFHSHSRRLYVFGFANGGEMAFRLAMHHPKQVRAIATVAASLPAVDNMDCEGFDKPIRVMTINGAADPVTPYEGGHVWRFGLEDKGDVLSARTTAERFARLHDEAEPNASVVLPHLHKGDDTQVTVTEWGPSSHPNVLLYTIRNGGHVLPLGQPGFDPLNGKTTGDLDAPHAAWDFFADN